VPSLLGIYLRDHEAAARAEIDLYRRASASQRDRPYGGQLRQLASEARADLDALRALMRQAGARRGPLLALSLRVGERIGRLKPNGRVVRRSPLSDLVEIEGLLTAAHVRVAAWMAVAAARTNAPGGAADLATLIERAGSQVERLRSIHRSVAASVLGPAEQPSR